MKTDNHSGQPENNSMWNLFCLFAWNFDLIPVLLILSLDWISCPSEIEGMALTHEDSSCFGQELGAPSW